MWFVDISLLRQPCSVRSFASYPQPSFQVKSANTVTGKIFESIPCNNFHTWQQIVGNDMEHEQMKTKLCPVTIVSLIEVWIVQNLIYHHTFVIINKRPFKKFFSHVSQIIRGKLTWDICFGSSNFLICLRSLMTFNDIIRMTLSWWLSIMSLKLFRPSL